MAFGKEAIFVDAGSEEEEAGAGRGMSGAPIDGVLVADGVGRNPPAFDTQVQLELRVVPDEVALVQGVQFHQVASGFVLASVVERFLFNGFVDQIFAGSVFYPPVGLGFI